MSDWKEKKIRLKTATTPDAPKHRKKSTGRKNCAKTGEPCAYGPWEEKAPGFAYGAPDLVRYCVKCRRKRQIYSQRWTYVDGIRMEFLAPGYGAGFFVAPGSIDEGF